METLIWYSVPGAIASIAIIATNPELFATDGSKVLATLAVPILGFFLHQFYRVLFEARKGFGHKSRTALDHIQNEIASKCGIADCDRDKAFLIWEITFYDDQFPSSLREHIRGAWHYILSFRSAVFAAILGVSWITFQYCVGTKQLHLVKVSAVEVMFGIVFALKARYTHKSLMRQELAATFRWHELFAATCERLLTMPAASRR